jgi:hypothetical protein
MTRETNKLDTIPSLSASAIFFAALIGIGFCVMLAGLGWATSMTFLPETGKAPSDYVLALIGFLFISIFLFVFFAAGFIASKVAHQQDRFASVIHSLGTWTIISMFLMFLLTGAATFDGIRRGLSNVKLP